MYIEACVKILMSFKKLKRSNHLIYTSILSVKTIITFVISVVE